jgi:hypothetical protein
MGNSISLEENEYGDQGNDVEIRSVSPGGAGDNDVQQGPMMVKKSKRHPNDVLKKRRSTSKNNSINVLKKTKSIRRR